MEEVNFYEGTEEERKDWKHYRIKIKTSETSYHNPVLTSPNVDQAVRSAMAHLITTMYIPESEDINDYLLKLEVIEIMEIESGVAYEDSMTGMTFCYDFDK